MGGASAKNSVNYCHLHYPLHHEQVSDTIASTLKPSTFSPLIDSTREGETAPISTVDALGTLRMGRIASTTAVGCYVARGFNPGPTLTRPPSTTPSPSRGTAKATTIPAVA